MTEIKGLRHWVFWPPFLVLTISVFLSLTSPESFVAWTSATNTWLLAHFDWLFSYSVLFFVVLIAAIFCSPFGAIRIGGRAAKPKLTLWNWFAITLCTTIATGLLFWGAAEPIFHLTAPPESLGLVAGSAEAARFALSTLFLHWTFSPYAIYTVPALAFALAFHNRQQPFSLVSNLFPFFRGEPSARLAGFIDSVCLLALVLGMAASLGSGVMTVLGGIDFFYPLPRTPLMFGLVCALIVGSFLVSAMTGLMKGITFLSSWNARIFVALSAFIFFFGPMGAIVTNGVSALGDYFTGFLGKSLFIGSTSGDPWPQNWSVFYWANWLAWAPVTAMFLGQIAYGYTVRAFIAMNWILPSLFGILWMSIFGGATLQLQLSGTVDIAARMKTGGAESAVYALLEQYPFSSVVIAIFVFTTFLSFVTGADANTEAMGAISTRGVRADNPGASPLLKFAWGLAIGIVSWVMVSFAGLNGIRMLSNLGGFPALLLVLAVSIGLAWIFLSGKFRELDKP